MKKLKILTALLLVLCLMGCSTQSTQETTVPEPSLPPQTTAAPETEPPTQPPTEPPVVETARATLMATGDIMMHIPVINAGKRGGDYQYDSFFAYLTDYVAQADFAVANLETTLAGTENGDVYSGFPKFNCPDAIVDALKNAGFDLLLTANNHTCDTGAYGMERTQQVIRDRGLQNLGTTLPEEEPWLVQDINGIRVGMVCYTYGQIDPETGRKSVNGLQVHRDMTDRIQVFDYEQLDRFYAEMEGHLADMAQAGAEATVVFIHWGNEYQTEQNSYQTAMAQQLCDLGVDVIVGGHPHVLQGVELLSSTRDPEHRTICVYSLGNALSNQRAAYMRLDTGHTEDGMLFYFTFVKYSDGRVYLDSVRIVPTWVYIRYTDTTSYDILPLDPEQEDWRGLFQIGQSTFGAAQASYERSMAILSPGLETVERYLAQSRADREADYGAGD